MFNVIQPGPPTARYSGGAVSQAIVNAKLNSGVSNTDLRRAKSFDGVKNYDTITFSDEGVKSAIENKVGEIFRIYPNGGVEPDPQRLDIIV
jgi:hypothetical protein